MSTLSQLEAARLMMNGAIGELPEEEQEKVRKAKAAFQQVIDEYGEGAFTALSIFGIEKQIDMLKEEG